MLRRAACLLSLLILSAAAMAQGGAGTRQPRILLLLDASSSMLQPWNTTIRFKAAGKVIAALMDSIYAVNPGVEFGLRVYGHQSPAQLNDCFDSRQEVMFSKNNAAQMDLRLASLRPFGVSPIAYSLREAAENDLVDEVRNAYSVILVTDGGESCGGNICEVVKNLIERKIHFKPYILSLVDYTPLKDQYACLGTYLQVAKDKDIGPAISTIVSDYRPILSNPIMAVKSEPVTPRTTTGSTITIPAWIPDRSSLAAIRISINRPREFQVRSSTLPAPRRVGIPALIAVEKPAPAVPEVRSPVPFVALAPGKALTPLRVRSTGIPQPRRQTLPRLIAVARPAPEPVIPRPAEPFTALGINRRTVPVPVPGTRRVLSPVRIPALIAVEKPAPAPVIPRPAVPFVALRISNEIFALPVSTTRPVFRKVTIPRLMAVAKPEPAPVPRDMSPVMPLAANSRVSALPVRAFQSRPAPRRVSIPVLARVDKPAPAPVEPPPARRDTMAAVKPAIPANRPARPDTMKTTVVIKRIDMPVAPKPSRPARTQPPVNKPKETDFTSETEDAKETSLAIYFTDGRGKFYTSTPQLQLLDAATGKLVKQFYRTVDAAGNPDPQELAAGTYNLLVTGRANMLMKRIVIEKDKKNKVIVKVRNGTLRFRYEGAPDRPVEEFDAVVDILFEPGPTVKQRCTAELEYVPGNYHIEINTLPVDKRNVDIDFGGTTEITIPQPGYVQFTNTAPLGNISLYTPLGNKFVRFYALRITGNPADQRLRLQPGAYEVHWAKNPSMPYASETVVRFQVVSNSVTEVELH